MNTIKSLAIKILLLAGFLGFSQEKNFIDKPYIEAQGTADTLVVPNRIYIDVLISEKDTKGKKSVEELENEMLKKLKTLGVDTDKNVTVQDMASNFKKYFLKQTDIQKAKSYTILTYDAKTTAKIFIGLEEVSISNVSISKLEHSEQKKIQLIINSKAMENAKMNAISFTKPLNQNIGKAIYVGYVNNHMNGIVGQTPGLKIRGYNSINTQSTDYDTNIEFEKIKISSNTYVRFALD